VATTSEKTQAKKEAPDHLTKISFYINAWASVYFLFFNLITLLAVNNNAINAKYKQLHVLQLIEKRGAELGFESGVFQTAMNQYYVISLILFLPIALSLLFLWKKRMVFYPIIMFSVTLQILFMIILLGPTYFWVDMTFTDKLMWLILLANSSLYRVLLKKEKLSGKISFFD